MLTLLILLYTIIPTTSGINTVKRNSKYLKWNRELLAGGKGSAR